MEFLAFTPTLDLVLLFGAVLVVGTLVGRLCRQTKLLPPISGYLLLGVVIGPQALGLLDMAQWEQVGFLFDLCLGLIVYDLGRHLDWHWLRADRSLLKTALLDAGLTIVAVLVILFGFGFATSTSIVVAIIAIETSPAVLMLVMRDLQARGSVTRRLIVLTGLNNIIALVLLGLILPLLSEQGSWLQAGLLGLRHLLGPIACALVLHGVHLIAARLVGKSEEAQFLLLFGSVALAIGLAHGFGLSVPLSLLMLGMAARNLNARKAIQVIDYSQVSYPFLMVLFVLAGAHLRFSISWLALAVVVLILLSRYAASAAANMAYMRMNLLTLRQCQAIGLALAPMSAMALAMASSVAQVAPSLSEPVRDLVGHMVALQHLLAPIAIALALRWVGEVDRGK